MTGFNFRYVAPINFNLHGAQLEKAQGMCRCNNCGRPSGAKQDRVFQMDAGFGFVYHVSARYSELCGNCYNALLKTRKMPDYDYSYPKEKVLYRFEELAIDEGTMVEKIVYEGVI